MSTKKKKNLIRFIGFICGVVIPIGGISLNVYYPFTDMSDETIYIIGVILAIFSLLSTIIQELLIDLYNQTIINRINLESFISSEGKIRALNVDERYQTLDDLVTSAKSGLELMYLGARPPEKLAKKSSRDLYINSLNKVICKKQINVSRIIYYCDENKEWIKQMVDKNNDNRNFSLYLITSRETLPFSIQVIDNNVIFIDWKGNIAVEKKDFLAHSQPIKKLFCEYYRYVRTKECDEIIKGGQVNEDKYNKYLNR